MERYTFMSDGHYTISSEKCFEDQNGDYCGDAIDRLAYYENLIEDGRLVLLSIEGINPLGEYSYKNSMNKGDNLNG